MWKSQWFYLSTRIGSLLDAARFLVSTFTKDKQDFYAANIEIRRNAEAVVKQIEIFQNHDGLPDLVRDRLKAFLDLYRAHEEALEKQKNTINPPNDLDRMQWLLTVLAALRSELDYVLSDFETVTRSLVNRAFEHLKRCIRADDDFGERWRKAYAKDETACEKLGAVHLLHHGIWTFKANGPGSRTDLVLGTPIVDKDLPEIERASNALVLTEWKLIRNESELNRKANEAYKQAVDYGESLLAGFELASRRYLVLVSEKQLPRLDPLPDSQLGRLVIYEYVNIPVSPLNTSNHARCY
jgi:hypothetical protein